MKIKLLLTLAALLGVAIVPFAQAGLLTRLVLQDASTSSPAYNLLSTDGTPCPAAGKNRHPMGVNWSVGTPLLRPTAPGRFKLTGAGQKATQLTTSAALSLLAPQTTIIVQGQWKFVFNSPNNAAFCRLEAR